MSGSGGRQPGSGALGRAEAALFSGVVPVVAASILLLGQIWIAWILTAPFLASIGGPEPSARVPDFLAFWGAGQLAVAGEGAAAYDPAKLDAVQEAGLGWSSTLRMTWFHPPMALFLAAPLGWLPLGLGFGLWVGASLAALMLVAWLIHPRPATPLLAAACLPSLHAAALGQMSFWLAAAFGAGLLAMADRGRAGEIRAGLWLAVLAVKPHLGVVLPLGLAASGKWRVIAVAAAAGLALMVASVGVFGLASWEGFLERLSPAMSRFEGTSDKIDWALYVTAYGALRAEGMGFGPALAIHGIHAAAALVALLVVCRRAVPAPALVAALLAYATVLAVPRMFLYDATILAVGAAFQCRHAVCSGGFVPGERSVLAAVILAGAAATFIGGPWRSLLPILLFWGCWLADLARSRRRIT